jgi:hypothetical protein
MKIVNFLLSRTTIGVLITIAVLIAFNATRTDLKTEKLASFIAWQEKVSPLLSDSGTEATPPKVSVTVRIDNPEPGQSARLWSLPKISATDSVDRNQIVRVLQLIAESKVFGLPQAPSEGPSHPTLQISISDESNRFETIVPLSTVDGNIQLQNLLKLLEVFASTPRTEVNPAQL